MTTDADGAVRGKSAFSTLHRLEFDVPWPPKHVAAYLLDGPEPILIDAGRQTDASEATLERSLAEFDYSPADIDHVLVTHAHSDHIGQVPTLSDAGATIHGPAASLERLERDPETVRSTVRETARSTGYTGEDLEEIVDSEVDSFHRDRRLLDPATTQPIEPETSVSIGTHEFRTFETPGHEQNHLSYEVDLEGTTALFSGDALIEPFRAGTFHAGIDRGAYEGVDRYYDAMDRFLETSATHAFPGHGPTFTDPKRVATRTRERLDRLLEETLAALERVEPATPLEIAVERAGSVQYTAPVMDALGALGTLENRGLVAYDCKDGARTYRRRE
ncbi:Glyoxylase, beta-lactamase superfamily II [Natronorubrum sediminis]|uniref:Glyoxylase, beta-lactamase superfamily II n=1 Tax=Natronorubrum sediminis TaxID=640943 RepID=A0A1H6FR37_9EURY|nr:MBL fold metallo-hydrolase [Natronorubrum sediminis]SEH12204.1 Glyoxylase, beta-lactamase superfamily II [Natronorubrum sediminis]